MSACPACKPGKPCFMHRARAPASKEVRDPTIFRGGPGGHEIDFPRVDGAVAEPPLILGRIAFSPADDPGARSVPRYPNTQVELAKKAERVPLWLNLPVGLAHMAWAMFDGFKKYGIASWRKPEVEVTALSMIGAAERHLQLLKDGQDYAPDSHAHHAGHVMACMQIYLDCESGKKAGFDNRVPGPAPAVWPCQLPPR